jgi:hypothetical protein
MYSFIYFVIYNQQIQRGKSESFSRYNGSLIVSLAFGIHIMFILAIIKKIRSYFFNLDFFTETKNTLTPFVFILMISTFFYYNKNRTDKILVKYSAIEKPLSQPNIFKVICIIFIPLAFIIAFTKK